MTFVNVYLRFYISVENVLLMEILQSQTNLNKPVNDLHTEEKQERSHLFHLFFSYVCISKLLHQKQTIMLTMLLTKYIIKYNQSNN